MDVLKIATAGSVDDGKSTLIGRLLYDTNSLTDDKLEAIKQSSLKKGYDYLDFSLATDGLVAEREQGITIDVAHIYFATKKRSYIIADTPGHVEYTRNMVTGASTSQASIILIDARKGVIEQTKRHYHINKLLRVKHVIVAINKMDLVDFSETVFQNIKEDFLQLNEYGESVDQQITFVPISALNGDNVVKQSTETPWYSGTTILDYLENLNVQNEQVATQSRFPVQTVIRPKSEAFHDFRGYAGKLYGNTLQVGDEVTVLPSNKTSKIKEILAFNEYYKSATHGASITITLEDDINVTRGDIIVKKEELPVASKEINATVCWMNNETLHSGEKYIVQHNTNNVLAKVATIESKITEDFSGYEKTSELKLNEIGEVSIKLSKSVHYDSYKNNKTNGSFILIHPQTKVTAGVGFIK